MVLTGLRYRMKGSKDARGICVGQMIKNTAKPMNILTPDGLPHLKNSSRAGGQM